MIQKKLYQFYTAINKIAEKYNIPILYPCHLRSRNRFQTSRFKLDSRVIQHEPLGFHDYNCLQMNAFAVVSDSGTLPEESSFLTFVGHPFPAICIRTSNERPEALGKACFILSGIDEKGLLQFVDTAVAMNKNGDYGIPVPNYVEGNVSTKIVKIIQSYTGIVNKMVWRKNKGIIMVGRVKSKIKNFNVGAKSAVIYTLSILFSRGLAILSVPIFTRIMSTSEMGVVNLYNSWYSIISSIATLSLTSGGYIVALKEFSGKRDEYQSSVLSLTTIIALAITLIFAINPMFWGQLLGLPVHLLWLMVLGFLFAPARDFWLARKRFEYKYIIPGAVTISSAIIATVLSVGAVIYSDKIGIESSATYRLFANYVVIYGIAFVIWLGTLKKGKTFFVKEYWVLSLQLSIPLVGYAVATQILNVSDRMMISKMVDNSSVGIYGTIYTVSSLSLMIWGAIHSSFVPYLYQNIDKPNTGVKKVSGLLVVVYGIIAILITYLAPEIVAILATEEYYEAIYIMPPIAAGVFLTCLTNLYSDIPVYFKKTKYVMYPAVIAAVLNLILNYIFIEIYGYMAAAYTTMASYIVWVVLQAFWANLIEKQQGITEGVFNNKHFFAISIVTMLLCMLGIPLYNFKVIRYVAVCVIIVISLFTTKSKCYGTFDE